jgi:recombinational DNA repair protein RecT
MIKRYILPCLLTILSFITFYSCGSSTEIIGEWSEDEYKTGSIDKLLILGVVDQKKPLLRRKFEDGLVNAFKQHGTNAVASMDYMPYDEIIDSTSFEKYFSDLELDAVLVSRLVGIDRERKVEAGYAYVLPYNNYYGFYGYYYAAVQYANTSSYLSKNVVVVLETNLYETKNKKIIWSGISETIDPDKASDVIKSLGAVLADKLSSEGFLAN